MAGSYNYAVACQQYFYIVKQPFRLMYAHELHEMTKSLSNTSVYCRFLLRLVVHIYVHLYILQNNRVSDV